MMISYKLKDCKEKKDLSRKGKCRYGIYFTTMQYTKYSNLDYWCFHRNKERRKFRSVKEQFVVITTTLFILSRTIIGELSILTRSGSCFKSFGGASRIVRGLSTRVLRVHYCPCPYIPNTFIVGLHHFFQIRKKT